MRRHVSPLGQQSMLRPHVQRSTIPPDSDDAGSGLSLQRGSRKKQSRDHPGTMTTCQALWRVFYNTNLSLLVTGAVPMWAPWYLLLRKPAAGSLFCIVPSACLCLNPQGRKSISSRVSPPALSQRSFSWQ